MADLTSVFKTPPPILSPYFSSPLSVLFSLSKHVFSRSPFSPDSRLLSLSFRLSTPLLPQVPFFSLSSNLDRAVVGCAPEVLVPSQTTPKLSNGGTPAGRSKDPAGKAASRHWSFPLSSAPAPSCQLSTSPVWAHCPLPSYSPFSPASSPASLARLYIFITLVGLDELHSQNEPRCMSYEVTMNQMLHNLPLQIHIKSHQMLFGDHCFLSSFPLWSARLKQKAGRMSLKYSPWVKIILHLFNFLILHKRAPT